MALIPLAMMFEGDYAIYLLPVESEQTIADVAARSEEWEIPARVLPRPGTTLRVRRHGSTEPFPPEMTVAESGLGFMDPIEVYFA
jgi:toluene monooxygenase system protein B